MEQKNKMFWLWGMIVALGLMIIIGLSKINIKLAGMYPDVSSVILGVHGIGIVVGILMCTVGGLLGLLISNIIKSKKANVEMEKIRQIFVKWKAKQEGKNKSLIKDKSAVSYPLFIIILTFIIGTACYIILLPAINIISVAMNTFIAEGVVSVQTQDAYNFNLNLYKIMPLFLMIGLFLYAITQALLRKGTEG